MTDENKRVASVTLHMSEGTYRWLFDFLERSLPFREFTPQTHPLLRQMRDNVEWTMLIKFPKEEPAE